jgi:hypothetical protein
MPETPERKVLKKMLTKLKAKTITSETELLESLTNVFNQLTEIWKTMTDIIDKKTSTDKFNEIVGFELRELHLLIEMSDSCSKRTLEDFKLYIDSLEQYSSELDKTLNDIFEQAKNMAEEQRKQQEELKKKEPTYRV